jgi:hypothetical protein
MSKASRFEPSLTIQKSGLVEFFSIRMKKKNAKAAKPPGRCMFLNNYFFWC